MTAARFVTSSVFASLLVLATAGSASAAPADTGFWYYDVFHVEDAHAAGLTGEGVTIAVLDSQVNLEVPTLADADITLLPSDCLTESGDPVAATSTGPGAAHGTNILSLIVGSGAGYPGQTGVKGVAPDAHILYAAIGAGAAGSTELACFDDKGRPFWSTPTADAIQNAVDAGADIISVSASISVSSELVVAIARAEHEGVVIVAGLPNTDTSGDITAASWPAAANGVVSVQAVDSGGAIQAVGGVPNTNALTDVAAPGLGIISQGVGGDWQQQELGSGTSNATPIVSGFLALVKQKYPKATGNQLVLTLIRNTGTEDHEPIYDGSLTVGYGIASLTHMLRLDPTGYEDLNPLVTDDDIPTAAEIADPPTLDEYFASHGGSEPAEDSGNAGNTGDETGADAPTNWMLPLLLGIVGLLLVIAVTVVIIVVAARRGTKSEGEQR